MKINLRVSLGVLLAVGCALSATAADRFDAVREQIREGMLKDAVPSIAVAVAKDGKIVWEEGFGWADREKMIPATQHTSYSLASISKPITATALMTLVQAGKIALDRPANDYLGNARLRARIGDANAATVRLVANHTSGLPLHYQFFYADEPYQRPSMDETILRYGNLVSAPGEQYEYSNLGYGVLDYIIERASGLGYADFMRREVFVPLGMTRTSVDIGPGLADFAATRYDEAQRPIPFYDFDHPGASAVFASAHDLVRFGMFHLKAHLRNQKAILSDASLDEMHRATSDAGKDEGYGVGFAITRPQGHREFGHTGGMAGVATTMRLFPDDKLAVVVLSNSSSRLPFSVAERIVTTMLPGWKETPRRERPAPKPFVVAPQLQGVWKGTLDTYTKAMPVELTFLPDGNVHAKVGDQLATLINDASFKDGVFQGNLNARIGTPDTERMRYVVELNLRLRGDVLNGAATAVGEDVPRVRNALTQWLELKKQ